MVAGGLSICCVRLTVAGRDCLKVQAGTARDMALTSLDQAMRLAI